MPVADAKGIVNAIVGVELAFETVDENEFPLAVTVIGLTVVTVPAVPVADIVVPDIVMPEPAVKGA